MTEFGNTAAAAKRFGCCQKTVVRKLRSGEWPGYLSWTGRWFVNLGKVEEIMTGATLSRAKKPRKRI